ncbi:hypothetical protein JAAARDRAFT_36988 [Jaapia argillacea MUCL 33604]|uniref:Uncharacterized protein n=1 Tax=Jaapia argillacea MUCL 33604 TaxID=933084 RepID=A0A067PP19_9AGAM|nr:hypothetical protein JAAARDRAFT_36988 [Jaapia argillacea MUCL 33604]
MATPIVLAFLALALTCIVFQVRVSPLVVHGNRLLFSCFPPLGLQVGGVGPKLVQNLCPQNVNCDM